MTAPSPPVGEGAVFSGPRGPEFVVGPASSSCPLPASPPTSPGWYGTRAPHRPPKPHAPRSCPPAPRTPGSRASPPGASAPSPTGPGAAERPQEGRLHRLPAAGAQRGAAAREGLQSGRVTPPEAATRHAVPRSTKPHGRLWPASRLTESAPWRTSSRVTERGASTERRCASSPAARCTRCGRIWANSPSPCGRWRASRSSRTARGAGCGCGFAPAPARYCGPPTGGSRTLRTRTSSWWRRTAWAWRSTSSTRSATPC